MALAEATDRSIGAPVNDRVEGSDQRGWIHGGDLGITCGECGGPLHLFRALLECGVDTRRVSAAVCQEEGWAVGPADVCNELRVVMHTQLAYLTAREDTDRNKPAPEPYHAYVIELDDDVPCTNGRFAVYVGQTAKTPEERFAQHKAGIRASRWVRDHGGRLRPDLFEQPCLRSQAEALTFEALLAARLTAQGWTVKGGV